MGDVVLANVGVEVAEKKEEAPPKKGCLGRKFSLGIEDLDLDLLKACLAELFGSLFLILFCVGSANAIAADAVAAGADVKAASFGPHLLPIAIAFGLGIGGIIHIIGDVSGGHVNPAVSLALLLDFRISLIKCIAYIIFQFAGGFAGAGILYGLTTTDAVTADGQKGANALRADLSVAQGFFLEAFATMFLVITVLATINENRKHKASYLQPLAIGVSILVAHIFLIPHTNCAINPMRGVVWNIVTGQTDKHTVVFLFAPFVGGIVSVPIFELFFNQCY